MTRDKETMRRKTILDKTRKGDRETTEETGGKGDKRAPFFLFCFLLLFFHPSFVLVPFFFKLKAGVLCCSLGVRF